MFHRITLKRLSNRPRSDTRSIFIFKLKIMVHNYTRIQEVQAIQYNGRNIGFIIDLVGLKNIEIENSKLKIIDPEYGAIEVQLEYYIVKDKENNINIYPKEYFESNFKLIH